MHTPDPDHTGSRVARARKSRRLTQRGLADASAVSYSTVTKLEQGVIAASPSVLGALARALSVPVSDLTGQPYLSELRHDQLDTLIEPIRAALDLYDLGADPEVRPRPLNTLAEEAERLCALVRATDLRSAASELPGLIEETTTLAHTDGSERAWAALASLYRTSYDVTTKLGYADLCTVALDRMDWAAQRASDPVLSGMRQYMRALAYLRSGHYRTGRRLITLGLADVEQAAAGRERDVATGQLHLGASVLCARSQDAEAATGHLDQAERFAEQTGPAETVHWLAFGPTNVRVHRVAALAELDQFPEAVAAADKVVIPQDWPKSRTSHHHAEVARAQMWMARPDDAFASLQTARKVAPQQTRYHPLVRETYAQLESQRRRMPETFSNFGAWLGM